MIRGTILSFGVVATLCIQVPPAHAHWTGPSDPTLKTWFDSLGSGKGLCCSFADGLSISDVDWDTKNGHYRVYLNGTWLNVPNNAVVTEPNRFGPAVVWPYRDFSGMTQIRCFLPGAGT